VTHLVVRLGTGLAAFLFVGCASVEGAGPGPSASLLRTCAPWGGPAVTLFLTDQPPATAYPTTPYVEIAVYEGVSRILGRRFDIGPGASNSGFAQDCPRAGACVPARAASLVFGHLNADSTIAVSYRLELPSGRVLRGAVRPRLSPRVVPCR
jgi:hypothetical protein